LPLGRFCRAGPQRGAKAGADQGVDLSDFVAIGAAIGANRWPQSRREGEPTSCGEFRHRLACERVDRQRRESHGVGEFRGTSLQGGGVRARIREKLRRPPASGEEAERFRREILPEDGSEQRMPGIAVVGIIAWSETFGVPSLRPRSVFFPGRRSYRLNMIPNGDLGKGFGLRVVVRFD
jgi:hypothetical protein